MGPHMHLPYGTMVRRINVRDATASIWGAITELMAKELHEGTFEDTIVVLDWDADSPSFGIGLNEDADMFDFDLMRENDHGVARRYAFAGGTGMRVPQSPCINIYYERSDGTIRKESDLNGEANVEALSTFGLDAEYRPIGDTEVELEDATYKIMASAAATLDRHHQNLWMVTESPIWDTPPGETAELYEDAIDLPAEKFADKDTDSATARIRDLSSIFSDLGKHPSKEDVIDALVEAKFEHLFDSDDEITVETWSDEEARFLDRMRPFFESDTWLNRVSTSRMARQAPEEYHVGTGAHKARKLVKASVVVDDGGTIHDALLSGDLYIRPQPTITRGGVLENLGDALIGIDPGDETALTDALTAVYDRYDVESPGVDPEDIVVAVMKAGDDTRPIPAYLSER